MADKAENENQGASAGGERREALRSDETGVGSTRVRESGFPMRKASTLPDVSAYSTSEEDDPSTAPVETVSLPVTSEANVADEVTAAEPHASQEARIAVGQASADPSSPVTRQIAVTGVEGGTSAPAASRSSATPADSTTTGPTPSGSTRARAGEPRSNREKIDDDAAPDTSSLTIRPPDDEVARRASQRDEAVAAKPVLPRVLQVVVAAFFPVILLAAAVRAVTTPLFLWVEYHRPGFPADSYGFSTEDRMTYGSYAMDYILNWAPARYLGELVNADGDQLFLDSEVGHMADVKSVLSTGFVVATVLALLAIAACVYLARRYPGGVRRALFSGAVATLVLAIALAVAGILAWETFFTQVHALFFADGTWTFRVDDTLIRLFPAQFWIDAAATVGALVLIGAVLTLVLTWPTRARREKSFDAYARRRASSGI